jgi:hypothetical protein
MLHAALTASAPTDQAALCPSPTTATKPCGAPDRAAIAAVRAIHRAVRIATRSTQRAVRAPAADAQTRDAHTNAASGPPALRLVPIAPYAGDNLPDRELAAHAAGLCAPAIRLSQGAPRPNPVAPFKPSRIDLLNRELTAKPRPTAPFKPFRTDPLNREPTAKPGPTVPFKPSRIDPLNREPAAKPATAPKKPSRTDPLNREPTATTGATAPRVTRSNASGAAATAQAAHAHDPASRPGQSGGGSKVRPAPAKTGGAAPTLRPSPDCPGRRCAPA